MKKKNVVILGSTGSIGLSSLEVARHQASAFRVVGLASNRNLSIFKEQIKEFSPMAVAMSDPIASKLLSGTLSQISKSTTLYNHGEGLEKLARLKIADVIICGVVGSEGLKSLVAALKSGKTVGLANKEALVVAGELVLSLVKKHKATLIPVDSEHSAIFQCLKGHAMSDVAKLILTASGGPFYRSKENLDMISVERALKHPTWKMGAKITVDSATLMNKGLEAIEAHYLFGVPMDKISILIHPESIVHSLVEFSDGALLAQLSHPDMRLPIQYAMTYPDRLPTQIKRLELDKVKELHFDTPDFSKFPCLRLALEAGRIGKSAPCVLSSSNEEAVQAFIGKKISFGQIPTVVDRVLGQHKLVTLKSLDDVYEVDTWARSVACEIIKQLEKN